MTKKSIFQLSAIARLSLGIVGMMISLLFIADIFLGIFPNQERIELEKRNDFAVRLTIQIVTLLESDNKPLLNKTLQAITINSPDILSIGIREASGWLAFKQGDHVRNWKLLKTDTSTVDQIRVPIEAKDGHWGDIEVSFKPKNSDTLFSWLANPIFFWISLFALISSGLIYIFLRQAMYYLDPSKAVPGRVNKAFDIILDSILVLDKDGRIVLANRAFKSLSKAAEGDIYGRKVAELSFIKPLIKTSEKGSLPWDLTLEQNLSVSEAPFSIPNEDGTSLELTVSSEPIMDDDKTSRGYLITLKNVTELHKSNLKLNETLDEIQDYRENLEKTNFELQLMAFRDPLTGCLNRRSFFQEAETSFNSALQGNRDLFCIMADIDHFKSVNDIYGHYVGDQVIQIVAKIFIATLRPSDLICRYGGEEFCILLSDTTQDDVVEICERLRKTIEETASTSIRSKDIDTITMSFGVASIKDASGSIQNLIDTADTSLYQSKENGRNRVTVWNSQNYISKILFQCHQPALASGITPFFLLNSGYLLR